MIPADLRERAERAGWVEDGGWVRGGWGRFPEAEVYPTGDPARPYAWYVGQLDSDPCGVADTLADALRAALDAEGAP